jgi:aspartyl/asparaginyl beta-hydroxylase (cupin superfamily)
MQYTQPTRGVVRLDDMRWDTDRLQADLTRFDGDPTWESLSYGTEWQHCMLVRPTKDGTDWFHPALEDCPAITEIFDAFPGKVMDASLARLGPGGSIGEHRDISGGVAMGVARFHVPIVTDPGVEFFVSGDKVYLGPGETWTLDTTYKHWLHNRSDVLRVHLIVDVMMTPEVAAMLPAKGPRDRLHDVHFAAICAGKGAKLAVKDPKALIERVRKMVKLKVFKQSVLLPED